MKFYKITCDSNVKYIKLYEELEDIGNFIIDSDSILFYTDINKIKFKTQGILVENIDPIKYVPKNRIAEEWIIENYRKFRVEELLKEAEVEKQEDLKKLYNIIKTADEIIDRKEDLVGEE